MLRALALLLAFLEVGCSVGDDPAVVPGDGGATSGRDGSSAEGGDSTDDGGPPPLDSGLDAGSVLEDASLGDRDGGDGSRDDGGGAVPAVVTPSDYDCTATALPARRTPVSPTCARDPSCREPRISGHRGMGVPGKVAPENTLAALRAAVSYGVDYSECDVRVSSDGTAVLMHDATIGRTTTGTGQVAALTLAQLKSVGIKADAYPGDFSCERVPTFLEALDVIKGRLQLIVDGSKIDDFTPIVDAVRAADAFDWVIYDHTRVESLRAVLDIEPRMAVQLRVTRPADLESRLSALGAHRPRHIHIESASPETMVPLVHAAGLPVFALGFNTDFWVEATNDPSRYRSLFEFGIDIVQSNRPELVADHLQR